MSSTGELNIVRDLFKTMNLLAGVDSDKLVESWLEKHEKVFYGYVSGCWLEKETDEKSSITQHKICDIFSGKHLCDVYVPADNKLFLCAAENSTAAFKTWSTMTTASRSRILYNIAQTIEKYQQLFVIVEAISSGKHVSKVKTKDVPDLIESFNYYSCCAAQLEKDWIPTGPVCVVAEEYNNPCINFSLRVSSILASGSSVLLLADVKSSLSSFLLAEICSESGLPEGVLNVIPIDQEKFVSIGDSPIFSKLIFTGSLERSTLYSKLCAEARISCDILIPKRPVVIVYEKAHLHSAADGVLEAFFSHDTRSKSGGCKVMVQESISEQFLKILNEKFSHILVGQNTSKTDMSCIVTEDQKNSLSECLEEAEKFKGKSINVSNVDVKSWKYAHMMPTVLSNLPTNFKLVYEELGGPIIVVVPFRTIKESLSMFNCDNKGAAVSIWTNHVSVAMEVALKLKTAVVWVNSQNVNDAKIPYSGIYSSGNSVEGGKEALFHHMSVTTENEGLDQSTCDLKPFYKMWSSSSSSFEKSESSIVGVNSNVKEYKLFIGGTFKCSDSGTIKYEENIFIPSGNESDVLNAVSSAVTAQPKWESLTELQKRKIFFAIMDKLKKARKEYVDELHKVTKSSVDECEKEFDTALDFMFNIATQDDKLCGAVQEIKKNIVVLQKRCPLGIIGIQCSANKPLLSFITLIFSAIHYGNAVVAMNNVLPTIALKMCEIFSSANVPSGVINIICGDEQRVISALCKNSDVNAIWFTDVPQKLIYDNVSPAQRIFHCNKIWNDFNKTKNLKCAVECTFIKAIFLPAGEIFAN